VGWEGRGRGSGWVPDGGGRDEAVIEGGGEGEVLGLREYGGAGDLDHKGEGDGREEVLAVEDGRRARNLRRWVRDQGW
jgi:hypothetical protein